MTVNDPKNPLPGDPAARFMRLFASNQRRLFGYAFALVRHEADADDVVQESLGVMWTKFESFDTTANADRYADEFAAWATSITRLKALELFAQRRRDRALFSPSTMAAIADRMDTLSDRSEHVHDALSTCLGKLPAGDRKLVEARYQDDVHADELAKRFDKSRSQIYRSLNRIYSLLLSCIETTLDAPAPGSSAPADSDGGKR